MDDFSLIANSLLLIIIISLQKLQKRKVSKNPQNKKALKTKNDKDRSKEIPPQRKKHKGK